MNSVLNQISYYQNRRDEVPNQELARRLVEIKNKEGIAEIAENLWNPNRKIQSDCIKVLYEIGYRDPGLIASYAVDFLKLLRSRSNRMVWGGMIALSTIAEIAAGEIDPHREEIEKAMARGSVITVDAGVQTLASLAATSQERREEIFPTLLEHLRTCRPKDAPQRAGKVLVAVNGGNRDAFIRVLEKRLGDLKPSQAARLRRVIRQAQAIQA